MENLQVQDFWATQVEEYGRSEGEYASHLEQVPEEVRLIIQRQVEDKRFGFFGRPRANSTIQFVPCMAMRVMICQSCSEQFAIVRNILHNRQEMVHGSLICRAKRGHQLQPDDRDCNLGEGWHEREFCECEADISAM